jgi:integrase
VWDAGANVPQTINKLTARQVETVSEPGRYGDGAGLYLLVGLNETKKSVFKKWVFRYMLAGRRRDMGLGPAGSGGISLAQARAAAGAARDLVRDSIDPIDNREAALEPPAEPVLKPTFGEMATALVDALSPEWRNAKHRQQWQNTLANDAAPLMPRPIDAIDTVDVLAVLKPIWQTKPETASRLRGRIERVLNYAKTLGYRDGENPAAWRGHLANVLPRRQMLTRGHHAALPYDEVPAFVALLGSRNAVAAHALEFTILTAARSGEVYGMSWGEVDLTRALWTVPPGRMKGGREHRVPLSSRAVELLKQMERLRVHDGRDCPVFPGARRGRPMSNMAMEMMLRRLGRVDITVHGFRSSFRDWAGECTPFPREVAEAALAHLVGDATERAYRRGDAIAKRRELMEAWASYVAGEQN